MKWFKRVLLGTVGLVLLAFTGFYAGSEYVINKHYAAQSRAFNPADFEYVAGEGERLARVFGCYQGCHGRHMEGAVAFDEPPFMKAVAPSLGDAAKNYSTEQLEAIIRQGVRPDGRSVWGMPASSFASMTDRHLAAVLGFIGGYPEHEPVTGLPELKFYAGGRMAVLTGMFEAQAVVARRFKPFDDNALDDPMVHGRYLAMNTCSECHNTTLEGFEGFTPSLAVAKGYNREQFERLLSEGAGLGGRDLGLMSEVAKARFSQFEAAEVDALYDYLQSR